MKARTLMVQGTSSDAGKSLLVTALCRIYARRGLSVRPFKAQNMSLNAAVTPEGHEIGRAQATQAEAAGVPPSVHMNPILLKPEPGLRSQVVVHGEVRGVRSFGAYRAEHATMRAAVEESLNVLRAEADLVLVEGAGSPAEINLRDRELANMAIASMADAPVILVGDIDRGGVFASLYGTLALLRDDERARVAGMVINKLRGESSLLRSGIDELEARTGVPVLGVLPYLPDLGLPDEDSLALDGRRGGARAGPDEVEVAVVRLPSISNFDDLLPLERERGVVVRYVTHPREIFGADLVMIPGSKSTLFDLSWLQKSGMARAVVERATGGGATLGICGGCQILGGRIVDASRVEGRDGSAEGLSLLPVTTHFGTTKRTLKVKGESRQTPLWPEGLPIEGYFIHAGRLRVEASAGPALVLEGEAAGPEGARSSELPVVGTMVHGIFESRALRSALLERLGRSREMERGAAPTPTPYDVLADAAEKALDLEALGSIIEGRP